MINFMNDSSYIVEYKLSSNKDIWIRMSPFSNLNAAKNSILSYIECRKGYNTSDSSSGLVTEWRLLERTYSIQETEIESYKLKSESSLKLIEAKKDELHYLHQIYKYLNHLEHSYKSGELKDNSKAYQINISLENTDNQIKLVEEELSNILKLN